MQSISIGCVFKRQKKRNHHIIEIIIIILKTHWNIICWPTIFGNSRKNYTKPNDGNLFNDIMKNEKYKIKYGFKEQ